MKIPWRNSQGNRLLRFSPGSWSKSPVERVFPQRASCAIAPTGGALGQTRPTHWRTLNQTLPSDQTSPTAKLNVKWTKGGFGGVEIWVDRGSGTFAFLAIDTVPDYLDTSALPAPGQTAVWKYKAIYRLNDAQVGEWSDVVSKAVQG